jgi:uncharacterized paraquat-inducible protein A
VGLIACPECSKSISDTAVSCPSCGYQLDTRGAGNSSAQKALLIVAICLGVVGAIVGFTVGNPIFGAAGAAAVAIGAIKLAIMA